MTARYEVQNEGSIILIRPLDAETKQALRNITPDDAQWFGGALVVEWRYADDIINALENGEGFEGEVDA